MDGNLVNGWYKCIEGSTDWTEGEFYYFVDGLTRDDKGNKRPACSSPQKYNDPCSESWFRLAGLVPADENEVQKMKHNTMEDYRINGFYKATKTDSDWSEGRQYYFRDGYTVDDNGKTRPLGRTLKHGCSIDNEWLNWQGLIPATDETDIFNRVNDAAVSCVDNHISCDNLECPYRCTPNCKDQMISDFKALREMRGNRKSQEQKSMPSMHQAIMVGRFYRNKITLEVFEIISISVSNAYAVELRGVGTRVKTTVDCTNAIDFYDRFEPWHPENDGGNFDFVVLEDLDVNSVVRSAFKINHVFRVINGEIIGIGYDFRFKSYEELEKHFGNKTIQTDCEKRQTENPADGLYTGYAIYTGSYRPLDNLFTVGKVYRFTNGLVNTNAGHLKLFESSYMLAKLFRPIVNMEGV